MNAISIDSIDDPRIAPYRMLKERELAREGGRFIAEGEMLVRRLIASAFTCESVLLAERRVDHVLPAVPAGVAVYVAPAEIVNAVLGFKFHSGVMAVGLRGQSPTLDTIALRTLVICPEIEKTDNLGALIRVSTALGADAMILGERSCDPFFRQSVRVSMGAVFTIPIVRSQNLAADLLRLRDELDVELCATVLSGDAQDLRQARRGPRIGLLFGNEAQGLGEEWINLCRRRITLPMHADTDSLNIAAAAAVFLYHFT